MNTPFASLHPVVLFLFFIFAAGFSMFLMHPVFLVISFICAFSYCVYLKGKKGIKSLGLFLPVVIFAAIINAAFNHEGITILVYVNDNPITLESLLYSLAAALMLLGVFLWFSCLNEVMTSDKLMCIFGKISPSIAILFSMTLRFVPRFSAQLKKINYAQKCIGRSYDTGGFFTKIRNGVKILSILITWALENAVETADSMKSRGWGLKGRTSFSGFRFDKRDALSLTAILILVSVIFAGLLMGEGRINYYPAIVLSDFSFFGLAVYISYFLLMAFPLIFSLTEDFKWYRLKSKI